MTFIIPQFGSVGLGALESMQMPTVPGMPVAQHGAGLLGNLGSMLFPAAPGMDPQQAGTAQNQAMMALAMGLLKGGSTPGSSFGGSLADAYLGASGSYQGAMDNAFKRTLTKQQMERQERADEREQKKAEREERQTTATTAGRISTGLGSAQDPMAYFNLVKSMPEVQEALTAYGIDPATITTPEQLQAVNQQLSQAARIGGPATPPQSLQLKAIMGPDGKPILVPAQQAIGQTPFYESMAKPPEDKSFSESNVLRDEYSALTKDFGTIEAQYGNILATSRDASPAGDIALITSYMKMLDPTSTVREGEFATAANAGGIPDYVRARYNQLINGKLLSENQRADFVRQADSLYQQKLKGVTRAREQYTDLARRFGLDPMNVVGAERQPITPSGLGVGQTTEVGGFTVTRKK